MTVRLKFFHASLVLYKISSTTSLTRIIMLKTIRFICKIFSRRFQIKKIYYIFFAHHPIFLIYRESLRKSSCKWQMSCTIYMAYFLVGFPVILIKHTHFQTGNSSAISRNKNYRELLWNLNVFRLFTFSKSSNKPIKFPWKRWRSVASIIVSCSLSSRFDAPKCSLWISSPIKFPFWLDRRDAATMWKLVYIYILIFYSVLWVRISFSIRYPGYIQLYEMTA